MKAGADAILIPKANTKEQMLALEKHINELEKRYARPIGSTDIIPNIEQAKGLVNSHTVLSASKQIVGSLVASEDMAAITKFPTSKK